MRSAPDAPTTSMTQTQASTVIDQETPASQVKADRFPFPCEGDITLAVRNANYALGR
jgi:hypothetical protein